MIIENALRAHLVAQAGLTALVGQRIYYMNAPQNVKNPYIVLFKVSAVPEYSLTGHSGLINARFQFDIYADTYYETKQISEQIALAIQDKCNEVIGGVGGVNVSVQFENEQDLFELNIFHCIVEYFIQYNE
jgi:hypothetical protein